MDIKTKYLRILKEICAKTDPGKKVVQKLMYLIERKGVNLELDYSIHYYGPYSSMLNAALIFLEADDLISIDTNGYTHKISVCTQSNDEDTPFEFSEKENQVISEVLDVFIEKNASELEALTTIDYVATTLLAEKANDEEIIQKVKMIKGKKFSDADLKKNLMILKEYDYVS